MVRISFLNMVNIFGFNSFLCQKKPNIVQGDNSYNVAARLSIYEWCHLLF